MKAPDKIYVDDLAVVNDCSTRISTKPLSNFSEYIRKDALWKPTDEQMRALNAICCIGELSYFGQEAELIRLYQELKKHNELFV